MMMAVESGTSPADGEVDVSCFAGAVGDLIFFFFSFDFLIDDSGSSKLRSFSSVRGFLRFFFFSVADSSGSSACFRFLALYESWDFAFGDSFTLGWLMVIDIAAMSGSCWTEPTHATF